MLKVIRYVDWILRTLNGRHGNTTPLYSWVTFHQQQAQIKYHLLVIDCWVRTSSFRLVLTIQASKAHFSHHIWNYFSWHTTALTFNEPPGLPVCLSNLPLSLPSLYYDKGTCLNHRLLPLPRQTKGLEECNWWSAPGQKFFSFPSFLSNLQVSGWPSSQQAHRC